MSQLEKIVKLTKAQYETLTTSTNHTISYAGGTHTYSDNNLYFITDETVSANDLGENFILPVSKGGTGKTSFTPNSLIVSGTSSTASLTTKAIATSITNDSNTVPSTAAVYNNVLLKSGGTLTGALTTANNIWNVIGDDCRLGDINVAGHIGIQGINGNTGIFFTTYNQSTKTTGGEITWNGTNFIITSTTPVAASISGNAATATAIKTAGTTAQFYRGDNSWSNELASSVGASTAILKLNTSSTISSSYVWGTTVTVPNLGSGANVIGVMAGQAMNAGNAGYLNFHYVGSNSNDNYVSLGLYSNDNLLKVYKTGNVSIGADNNSYKLYVNGTSYINGATTINNTLAVNNNLTVTGTALKITSTSGKKFILMGNQDSSGVNKPTILGAANGTLYIGNGTDWSANNGGTLNTALFMTADRKIGIGTTSPDTLLTVNGNAKADKFIGALQGNADTATSANRLSPTAITSLSSFTHTTDLIYAAAGGSNSVTDKPSGVDAFGVLSYKTADGWYGQILTSSNTGSGIYWRTGTTLSGGWKKILHSGNTASGTDNAASLTWNTTYTIAKINGTDIKFTTMAKPTYTYSDVGAAPSSTVSCTAANVKSALGTGTDTTKFLNNKGEWAVPAYTTSLAWSAITSKPNLPTGNARIFYGTSNTAAGTAAKVVTCSIYDAYTTGDILVVKFDNANTAGSPTLNVNSKGAKNIKKIYNGAINNLTANGEVTGTCLFIYDGTQWILTNVDYNNTYTIPTSFSITANATDGLWDLTGTGGSNQVTYTVGAYSAKQTTAAFYTAATNPTLTTRLNYDGYLYATKLYSGGTEVSVSGHTHSYLSSISWSGDTNLKLKQSVDGATATDVLQFVAGSNITLTGAAGKLTIAGTANNAATHTVKTTTKYYVTGTETATTSTGGDTFDTGIYATTVAGQLNATSYKVNENVTLQWNSTDSALEFVFA